MNVVRTHADIFKAVQEDGFAIISALDYPLDKRAKLDRAFEKQTGKELRFEGKSFNEIIVTIKNRYGIEPNTKIELFDRTLDCHVTARYNGENEYGRITGLLFKDGSDDLVLNALDGKPVEVIARNNDEVRVV